ncbi:putative phiE125 gp8 family phage protein [Mycoplana sp. BE70]|uniref:head-tail connector protein n=1 Tax=Mycoplana sp. BE70 TaxID=2817775 RepID=UPI002864A52A|nr:head-tail connector protein [Mycoplana sp. BE70]MDR6757212.1 putative phiE125 gp8 family phage protein [Mycoplana sp. BE70]
MTIVELMPPGAEPITLAEVKAHLRLDGSAEDELLGSLIRTARDHLERETGLALIARPFRLYLDDWPEERVIQIARGPVQAIESVTVYDDVGAPLEVGLIGAVLDGNARPARLLMSALPAPGRALNGIEIDFTAGFGEAGTDVPDTLKRALMIHVAAMYELRGVMSADDQPGGVPAGYDRLVAPFRMRRL